MTDDEFLSRFESCALEDFRHRDHVRIAWLYLRRYPYDRAVQAMEDGIRRFAIHHGALDKYHHTVTLLWMRLVAAAGPKANGDFDAFLSRHPHLLDKDTPRRFYSADRLGSAEARAGWIDPDLSALPDVGRSKRTEGQFPRTKS